MGLRRGCNLRIGNSRMRAGSMPSINPWNMQDSTIRVLVFEADGLFRDMLRTGLAAESRLTRYDAGAIWWTQAFRCGYRLRHITT